MKKNKMFSYIMAGALSVGVIGGAGVSAFAATNTTSSSTSTAEQAVNTKASLDDATKQKVESIMNDLKTQLAKLGVDLPDKGKREDILANLDATTKAKAQAIMDKEDSGKITHEEEKAQLAKLGVDLPDKGKREDILANLDATTKAKAQAIMDKEDSGKITHEEEKAQLAKLGVNLPERHGKGDILDHANLDAKTKAKAQALIDKAQTQLTKLGVNHLPFKDFKESNEKTK
ncbi:hypothetical protein [Priestia megaterium]|uniref:hypothetical protein n=1 Tax=Priestia megaterium TaxID=1404 RepID=UPI00159C7676|nr:hypothetical protein [Priestia megaterium]